MLLMNWIFTGRIQWVASELFPNVVSWQAAKVKKVDRVLACSREANTGVRSVVDAVVALQELQHTYVSLIDHIEGSITVSLAYLLSC